MLGPLSLAVYNNTPIIAVSYWKSPSWGPARMKCLLHINLSHQKITLKKATL